MDRGKQWLRSADIVAGQLRDAPDPGVIAPVTGGEFRRRFEAMLREIQAMGADLGIVYSNEHYCGDVPYFAGNRNITLEPVAALIGAGGLHLLAGLEGCYAARQFAGRSGAVIHKVEMMQLSDSEYPIEAERLEDVLEFAAGKRPRRIAILSPGTVICSALKDFLRGYVGPEGELLEAQEALYRVKYEKSDEELRLIGQASIISDVMVQAMVSVLHPGMTELQVAQWAHNIALEMGAEGMGFRVMVNTGKSNRTIVAPASAVVIQPGDYVHIGVAPTCDGLNACQRVSVVAGKPTGRQEFWLAFVDAAFRVGLAAFEKAAALGLPGRSVEQAVVDYYQSRAWEVSSMYGKPVDMPAQKPYASVHNTGYTECLEFYGAFTTTTDLVIGGKIANMLDVAVKGFGREWDDIVLPDLDYVVTEKTVKKEGNKVTLLNRLPYYPQQFVQEG
jgi:Xaa-Pro aminopeptidase